MLYVKIHTAFACYASDVPENQLVADTIRQAYKFFPVGFISLYVHLKLF